MFLTAGRIVLAPILFFLCQLAGRGSTYLLVGVWAVFLLIEASDLLDGHFARRFHQESELGKVIDPFADAICRLTYFIVFAGWGILPLWILLILVYRDLGVAYIRVMISIKDNFMPARLSGKLKAWIYAIAGAGGFLVFSIRKIGSMEGIARSVEGISPLIFLMAAAVALWSLADYLVFFLKNFRKSR
jgi:CDP-diacylglycerol--glycerol-3-phosphate 3-phosphatidyltransferase